MNTTTSPAPFRLVCKIDADGLYAGPVPAYLSPLSDQTSPLPANGASPLIHLPENYRPITPGSSRPWRWLDRHS